MEPARDVPAKSTTQDAPLADALRRATTTQSTRVVNPSNEAHAGSLRRNSARLYVPHDVSIDVGFLACHAFT